MPVGYVCGYAITATAPHQGLPPLDLLPLLDEDTGDVAGLLGVDGDLHLHGLEDEDHRALLEHREARAVVPVPGLADAAASPVTLGIVFGLVAGKTIGIVFATRIAVSAGLGSLPDGVTWTAVTGVALLAGIGFTVSLFVTSLAFTDPALTDLAKIGIFAGSGIAGLLGYLVLRFTRPTSS